MGDSFGIAFERICRRCFFLQDLRRRSIPPTIHPDTKPVSQKPRRQSVERQDFIRKEVWKLLDAGFIEEVHHPVWLANPVIVPKANGKLRMCIDYTNLNKACPKDPYPLPRIDQIVDSTSGCDLLSFLDAYSGFHQI
jgi:ribonuclease HI